ncbi:hypothetical protein [Rothia dentocariosa]|nr:hypothetical protein [Rothia dentocariosa]
MATHNLPAYKVGRVWKFKLSEIDEWVRAGQAAEEPHSNNPHESKEER